ncbi:flavin reductase family protein, partial [Mesorhizobium sp. M7D.F.Ca.US.004.03.1.1]|uniref:flavin reductase family protein n=1 Tax=Mesorhizobium sp. M7D.F.Ca.US.004.03.1.1 TaxID=2496702 RepID=UPI000FD3218C
LTERQRYKLLSGTIVPRPIALVTTISADGVLNAAPFSFFNILSADPGILALGIEPNEDGEPKDTSRNIRQTQQFTVNIVSMAMVERMNICAISFESSENELEMAGFETSAGKFVGCPYVKDAPAAFECTHFVSLAVSPSRDIILGKIVGAHFRDDVVDFETFRIDPAQLDPVGRIEGANYATVRDRFSLAGLTPEEWRKGNGKE